MTFTHTQYDEVWPRWPYCCDILKIIAMSASNVLKEKMYKILIDIIEIS